MKGLPVPLGKELKKGMVVELDGTPCLVERIQVQTPSARGATTLYKIRARDIRSKSKVDKIFRGSDLIQEADFLRRPIQFLYKDSTTFYFMDEKDFNQFSLDSDDIADQSNYLLESMPNLKGMIYNGEPVGVQLPGTVDLQIVQCDPGVKGNSATSRTKPATLSTGYVVQVPEYISSGETVRVDTGTGKFVCRVETS